MKKLLMLAVAAIALSVSAPAFAEHGGDHEGKGFKMFEEADTNKDGALSKEEFMARHEAKFVEIDTNADGSISKEEIEARRAEWEKKRAEWKASKEAEVPAADAPVVEEVAPTEGAE